jgi:hypothetical protein
MAEGLNRLQRIKAFGLLEVDDLEWLIEQAEKVEKHEKKIAVLLDEFSDYDYEEIAYQLKKMIND